MKKLLIMALLAVPLLLSADPPDAKYLAGAVPVIDGKVKFSSEVQAPGLSQQDIYDLLLKWAASHFVSDETFNARVLYTNPEEGVIASQGEEWIEFSRKTLSLDRSRIYYKFIVTCHPECCNLEMSQIRYLYEEERTPLRYNAEDWITDKHALRSKNTKLTPLNGKFRTKTIDLKNKLFKEVRDTIANYLLAQSIQKPDTVPVSAEPVQTIGETASSAPVREVPIREPEPSLPRPVEVPVVVETPSPSMISKEDIAEKAVRITVSSEGEQFDLPTECWAGMGRIFSMDVCYVIIDNRKKMTNMLMEQSESYAVAFYLPDSSEPALTLECHKIQTQPVAGKDAHEMNPLLSSEAQYTLYTGQITNE